MADNKKTIFALSLSLILLLFLGGCGGQKAQEQPLKIEIHTGTEGLVMDFESNMPPDEIFENTKFQIGVKASNKGAFNIENGILIISGYDPRYYGFDTYQKTFGLEGKSIYLPDGAADVYVFEVQNRGLPEALLELSTTFIARACYEYQTAATQEICIAPDILGEQVIERACEPKKEYSLSGQGAPVAVTSIRVKAFPVGDRLDIVFEITPENKGKGKLRASHAYQKDCIGPALLKEDIDTVGIRVFLGKDEATCALQNVEVGMDITGKNKNFATCRISVDKKAQAYTSPLTVYLDYGYSITNTKTIKVVGG